MSVLFTLKTTRLRGDAGILPGDVVVAMNGVGLAGSDDFICRVSARSAGQRVRLTVLHSGESAFLP